MRVITSVGTSAAGAVGASAEVLVFDAELKDPVALTPQIDSAPDGGIEDTDDLPAPEVIAGFSAVRLFVERAFHIVDPKRRPDHPRRLEQEGIDVADAKAKGQGHNKHDDPSDC